jgi:hypothetical protein
MPNEVFFTEICDTLTPVPLLPNASMEFNNTSPSFQLIKFMRIFNIVFDKKFIFFFSSPPAMQKILAKFWFLAEHCTRVH